MTKKNNFKLLVVIIIILVALALSVALVKKNQENRSKAASEETFTETEVVNDQSIDGDITETDVAEDTPTEEMVDTDIVE